MKIVVIDREDSWHVTDLKRVAGTQHEVLALEYETIASAIFNCSVDTAFEIGTINLSDVDCVITRAMPASSLEQVVFRMDWLAELERQAGVLIVNPAKTIEASVDKYLSLEKIRGQGVPVPKTFVSQNVGKALEQFELLNCDSVVKPLFGSGGRRIRRLTDLFSAKRHFEEAVQNREVIYQQEFVEHGDEDLRLFVVGEEVVGMHRKREGEWITNAQLGAVCTAHYPNRLEKEIALNACRSVGASIGGVDLVYDHQRQPKVVEINACPSWKRTSEASGKDVSQMVLNLLEKILLERHPRLH